MPLKFTGGFGPITGAVRTGKAGIGPPSFAATTLDPSTFSGTWQLTAGSSDRYSERVVNADQGGGKAFGDISGTDKVYYEVNVVSTGSATAAPWMTVGFIESNQTISSANEGIHKAGGWGYSRISQKILTTANQALTPAGPAYVPAGQVWGFALDMEAGALYLSVDGVWQQNATLSNIGSGITTGAITTTLASKTMNVGFGSWLTGTNNIYLEFNFGQDDWLYDIPAGFTGVPAP